MQAHAYPELVRHGYTNCITCHSSPAGGGLLTEYGRALSKEVLSSGRFFFERSAPPVVEGAATPEHPREEDFLYGYVEPPRWLTVGGDIRTLQSYSNTALVEQAQFIVMQVDAEVLATRGRFGVQGTIGRKELPPGMSRFSDNFVSHRHWLTAKLGAEGVEDTIQVRAGRFYPAYGLNIPDHPVITRQNLGFDQNQETYNAEFALLKETFNVYATALLGRPDALDLRARRGAALQASVAVGASAKVGVSGYTGTLYDNDAVNRRNLLGAHAIVGITPHHYVLFEVDGTQSDATQWGVANYAKFGWEFSQGIHVYATEEFAHFSFKDSRSLYHSFGGGIQYFPRTHWEFLLGAARQRTLALESEFETQAWLMMHYYL